MVWLATVGGICTAIVVMSLASIHISETQAWESSKDEAVNAAKGDGEKKAARAIGERDGYKSQLDALQTKYDTETKSLQAQVQSLSTGKAAIAKEWEKAEQDAAKKQGRTGRGQQKYFQADGRT